MKTKSHFWTAMKSLYYGFMGIFYNIRYTFRWSFRIVALSVRRPRFSAGEYVNYHGEILQIIRIRANFGAHPGFYYSLEKCPDIEFSEGVISFYKELEGAGAKHKTIPA